MSADPGTIRGLAAVADGKRLASGERSGRRRHAERVTTPTQDWLLHHVADLGVDVEYDDLSSRSRRGEWQWWRRTIVLHHALTSAQMVSVLAHELAHVLFGDTASTPANERRAWEYAAALLVTREQYAAAEQLVGSHPGALARELGVTPPVVEGWRRWWETKGWRLHGHEEAAASPAY